MINKQLMILIAIMLHSSIASLQAGNIEAGKKLSVQCQMCHGKQGVSINLIIPNLAGQKKGYLLKAMEDFKAERRRNKIMDRLFKKFSTKNIVDLATYYSSLRCQKN